MTKNNSKKKAPTKPRPVTEKILSQYIEKAIETVGAKIGETKKYLEAKIEYSRKDAGEQIRGVQKGLTGRMHNIEQRLGGVEKELKSTQDAIKSVKGDLEEFRAETKGGMQGIKAEMQEMKGEMHEMESRLSEKIDTRLDEHETKPASIAHKVA